LLIANQATTTTAEVVPILAKDVQKDVSRVLANLGRRASSDDVSGDPITTFNGKKFIFWVPQGTFVELITIRDNVLSGMASMPPTWVEESKSQWFTSLKLEVAGKEALFVASRPDILAKATNVDEQSGPWPLQTVEVRLDGKNRLSSTTQENLRDGMVVVSATRNKKAPIGPAYKETVNVKTENMEADIFSCKANKFRDPEMQMRYLHLDFSFKRFDVMESFGLLPEIWGIRDRSERTKGMIYKEMPQINV